MGLERGFEIRSIRPRTSASLSAGSRLVTPCLRSRDRTRRRKPRAPHPGSPCARAASRSDHARAPQRTWMRVIHPRALLLESPPGQASECFSQSGSIYLEAASRTFKRHPCLPGDHSASYCLWQPSAQRASVRRTIPFSSILHHYLIVTLPKIFFSVFSFEGARLESSNEQLPERFQSLVIGRGSWCARPQRWIALPRASDTFRFMRRVLLISRSGEMLSQPREAISDSALYRLPEPSSAGVKEQKENTLSRSGVLLTGNPRGIPRQPIFNL